jgi:UDP-glucose 4-epimerase
MIGELPIGVPNNLVPYVTQTAAGVRDKLTVFGMIIIHPMVLVFGILFTYRDVATAHVKAIDYLNQQQKDNLFDAIILEQARVFLFRISKKIH